MQRSRAKVEHPFRVIKYHFGHTKFHYRGFRKSAQKSHTLFALVIFLMVRVSLLVSRLSKPIVLSSKGKMPEKRGHLDAL